LRDAERFTVTADCPRAMRGSGSFTIFIAGFKQKLRPKFHHQRLERLRFTVTATLETDDEREMLEQKHYAVSWRVQKKMKQILKRAEGFQKLC